MSGGYGWSGDRDDGYSDYSGSSYSSARSTYDRPSTSRSRGSLLSSGGDDRSTPSVTSRPMSMRVSSLRSQMDDDKDYITGHHIGDMEAYHKLKSTARNVIIVAVDLTGSMADWPEEIVKRGGLMSDKLADLTGTKDNEFLVIGFGDGPMGDPSPIQVAPKLANDARLADYFCSLGRQFGGGNGSESADLALQYVMRNVDTSSAQQVFMFVLTDETTYLHTDVAQIKRRFKQEPGEFPLGLKETIENLRLRMELFTFSCQASNQYEDSEEFWVDVLGREHVLPVEYKYKVVETILGTVATRLGKADQFIKDLVARHSGTQYGDINIQSVRRSISLVQAPGSTTAIAPRKRASILTIGDD